MKSSRQKCLAVSIFAMLNLGALAQWSHAATFYVATNGQDGNPGTSSKPFRTMGRSVKALSAGDTLIVKGGTYNEVLLNLIPSGQSWSRPVTVQAASGETVVVRATSSYDGVITIGSGKKYIILQGLTLDASDRATFGLITNSGSSYIKVIDCEIKNARNSGMLIGGCCHEFAHLDVHDNGDSRLHHGIYLNGNNSLVENSRFYRNTGYGIHAYSGSGKVNDNVFRSNDVYSNTRGGFWVGTGVRNTVQDNDVWDNGHGVILSSAYSHVYHNTIYNNYGTSSDKGIGIIVLSPSEGVRIHDNKIYGNQGGNIMDMTHSGKNFN